MKKYKITFNINELDKPNRNGRIYSKEVIEKAFNNPEFFNKNSIRMVPIKDGNTCPLDESCQEIIGYCSIYNEYPIIKGEVVIFDKYKVFMKTPAIQGVGYVDNEGLVSDYDFLSIGLYKHTANPSKKKIKRLK